MQVDQTEFPMKCRRAALSHHNGLQLLTPPKYTVNVYNTCVQCLKARTKLAPLTGGPQGRVTNAGLSIYRKQRERSLGDTVYMGLFPLHYYLN